MVTRDSLMKTLSLAETFERHPRTPPPFIGYFEIKGHWNRIPFWPHQRCAPWGHHSLWCARVRKNKTPEIVGARSTGKIPSGIALFFVAASAVASLPPFANGKCHRLPFHGWFARWWGLRGNRIYVAWMVLFVPYVLKHKPAGKSISITFFKYVRYSCVFRFNAS